MNTPIRVLHVFASLDRGGAETMVMNLYRKINRKIIQFDFIVDDNEKKYHYEEEIKALGGKIFKVFKYKPNKFFAYKKAWKELLENHKEWQIIHIHHTAPAFVYLSMAKKKQLVTIVHSHTAGGTKNIKTFLKVFARFPLRFISDYLFACSLDASKWMFGRKSSKTIIINNSIDCHKYIYSETKRNEMRKELKLESNYTIGHIGNFSKAKNYPFILEVFGEILKQSPSAKLILIGKYDNFPEIKSKVKVLKLDQNVIFTGVRSDIPDLLQAMDTFLFPSLFEGLPVTLIEAQASGLKILASDTITDEVAITENVEFISLHDSAKLWAEKILRYRDGYDRKDTSKRIIAAGYDVRKNANELEEFYISCIK